MDALLQALRLDQEAVSRILARAPRWVAGALILVISLQVGLLVTGLGGADAPGPTAQPDPVPVAPAASGPDLPRLLASNLFGQAAALPADGANAPVTSMALVLAGVIAADDPQRGLAILGPSSAAVRVYATGAALPGGARLHAVHADRVILDRGGTLEALLLPRRQDGGIAPAAQAAQSDATAYGFAPAPSPSARLQQAVQQNPSAVSDIMRPQAVLADGRLRGYRVYPGRNMQAFNRLGLRPGDLVTAINGTPLDDPARGAEIFGTLSSAAEARITLTRNGSEMDVFLDLTTVANEAERTGGAGAAAVGQQAPAMGDVARPRQAR